MEEGEIAVFNRSKVEPFASLYWGPKYIEGQIIYIDNFENVIINITREESRKQRREEVSKNCFKRDEIIEKNKLKPMPCSRK